MSRGALHPDPPASSVALADEPELAEEGGFAGVEGDLFLVEDLGGAAFVAGHDRG